MKVALAALLLVAACKSDSGPATPDGSTPGVDGTAAIDAPDSSGWTPLISRSWTIPAGATDTYKCTRIQVANEMWITGFRAASPIGTHHSVLTVSTTSTQTGDYDCHAGSLDYQMLYAAGVNTDDLLFPTGVAMHIPAGSYINLNLHLFNVTDNTINDSSGILVKLVPHEQVAMEADMMFSGTQTINIPSDNVEHTAIGGCTAPQDWHIFTLWPHMHQTAVHQKWTYLPTGATVPVALLDDDYQFTEQKNYPIADTVIHAGEKIRTTCTYKNNTGHTETFGDSSNSEMCFTGMYKYPAGGNLFQCVGAGAN